MRLKLFKTINEHFSIKLFVVFGIMALLISFFFTGFYVFHQSKFLNTSIINKGIFQVGVLAHNSRIGVFSENEEFLNAPVEAIFQQDEVLEVLVFNLDGQILKKQKRIKNGGDNRFTERDDLDTTSMLTRIKETMQSLYIESRDGFEFWAPIVSRSSYALPEPLSFDEIPIRKDGGIIGYVMISMNKDILNKQLKELLVTSTIILVVFLVIAFFVSYFLAKGISKPLRRLINGVNTIGMGLVAEKLSVETRDEIGLLAEAFNDMAESLKKRENEVKTVNLKLMNQYEQRRMLSKKLIDLLERDREQVAMELHDHIGQILTSLKINLEIIQGQLKEEHSSLELRIKEAKERAVQAMKDIKHISRGLKPSVLRTLGLVSSLKELLNEIETNTDIKIKFFTHNVPLRLEKEKELAVYRITQEAMNNIIKHTNAGVVFINLVGKEGRISLSIEDNGSGFDLEKTMEHTNWQGPFGLLIMRERAEQLNGEFRIESEIGKGTYLLIEIPI
ncbi:MAG: sensor histidine kinase [Desulfobacteraceae bacterium]|jgi:signal transduction histidine kinase